MPGSTHTGRRLRDRRIALGIRQVDLARSVKISAAYLNLIEHNKRRIGGKLLLDLARALDSEPGALTEGAEQALIAALHEASAQAGRSAAETARAEEFAARFPGWAALLAERNARIADLERTVAALSDRMTHDPFLPTALHEILSSVTSIRSTAGILAGGEAVDADWQARFHRNLYEDSRRLADGAQSLVRYLDAGAEADASGSAPQDEAETWLAGQGHHVPALEGTDGNADDAVTALLADRSAPGSAPARRIARDWLVRYADDAARLPLGALTDWLADQPLADPAALARAQDVPLPLAMRRLASLPAAQGMRRFGLVICDGSGTMTFRTPIDGFILPRFGAACPLWPLYQALARPGVPIRAWVEQPGPPAHPFHTHAICVDRGAPRFDAPPILEATMLIEAVDPTHAVPDSATLQPIGSSCRICPRRTCAARREPSILAEGL